MSGKHSHGTLNNGDKILFSLLFVLRVSVRAQREKTSKCYYRQCYLERSNEANPLPLPHLGPQSGAEITTAAATVSSGNFGPPCKHAPGLDPAALPWA